MCIYERRSNQFLPKNNIRACGTTFAENGVGRLNCQFKATYRSVKMFNKFLTNPIDSIHSLIFQI